jgi:histidinol-phosphate phosphatase family protein
MSTAAVFIDKDGTLIENVPYNVDPAKIELAAGALPAMQLLHRSGFALFVVSNQAGVALGMFPAEALNAVSRRIRALLAAAAVPLAGIYFCPHHPEGKIAGYTAACACRKPQPGLLLRAAREHDIDLSRSWMVGDILDDIEAGRRAGCRTVLIDNGNETQWQGSALRMPHILVHGLDQAAHAIARLSERQPSAFSGVAAV